jgi:signal transduction histidine kinase
LNPRASTILLRCLALSVFGGLAGLLLAEAPGRLSERGARAALATLCILAGATALLACRGLFPSAKIQDDSADSDIGEGKDRKHPTGMEQSLPVIFHEIRNYASTLKGNTLLLRKGLADGKAEESLQRLERATEQIQRLSHEVLDLSLLGRPVKTSRVCLQDLIRKCAESYFTGLGITFSISVDPSAPAVTGDEGKLEQVFLNLFRNSLEAGATRIKVSVLAQRQKTAVLVEDDGKGCDSTEVEKMFDAYQSFRRSKGGSGLGLFLVKAIVEGHGGTIGGVSKNEKAGDSRGMIFVLHFPVSR